MKHRKHSVECDKFPELRPVLIKWCNLNKVYLNKTQPDCAWWYNERASISILAAAAWKCGYPALEEFSTEKRRFKRYAYEPGRCDLKIHIGSEDYQFEAKQVWARLGNRRGKDDLEPIRESILRSLTRARHAAGRLGSRKIRRFGISFVSPRIPRTQIDELDDRIDQLIDLLEKKGNKYHAVAWFFAHNWERFIYKNNIYPGVLLLIREVHKFQKPRKRRSRNR